jgi:hypothetical protein
MVKIDEKFSECIKIKSESMKTGQKDENLSELMKVVLTHLT